MTHPSLQPSRRSHWVRAAGLRAGLSCLLLAWMVSVSASAAAQTYAVVKTAEDIPPFEEAISGLKDAAGGNPIMGSLEADATRWDKVVEKLNKKAPSIWVPVGPLALKQAATLDSPVVFVMVATPERSLPGGTAKGNICGVTLRLSVDVQLREIRSLLPQAKRLGVLYDPGDDVSSREIKQAQGHAGKHGFTLVEGKMTDSGQLAARLDEVLGANIDALWLIADRTVTPPRSQDAFKYLAETTAKAGVPVVGYADKLTQAGALFSLGPDYRDIGAQAGEMVKKVAEGIAPSDIGIQNARKVSLSVNMRVASALGVTLPGDALSRAAATFD